RSPQAMYNLTVATAPTYFGGDGQWLVHNACGLPINQMNQEIRHGQAPPSIVRVDHAEIPNVPEQMAQVHFSDGSALKYDGSWKHGGRVLTNREKDWLRKWSWGIPE